MLEGRAQALPFSLRACRVRARGLCHPDRHDRVDCLRTSEPIFNVPTVVTATIAVLALIHALALHLHFVGPLKTHTHL